MGMRGQRHDPGRFTPGKNPVPIAQEAEWAPSLVWTGAENFAPTRIRSPDRPTRSESLYRLSYSGPPAANILNKQSRSSDKGWSSSWGLVEVLTNSSI